MTYDEATKVLEALCDEYDWFPALTQDGAHLILDAIGFKRDEPEAAEVRDEGR